MAKRGALGLAAGQLVGALVGELAEAGQGEQVVERQRSGVERRHHRQQLAHAERRVTGNGPVRTL
jgi:hypothetical protein